MIITNVIIEWNFEDVASSLDISLSLNSQGSKNGLVLNQVIEVAKLRLAQWRAITDP